MEFSLHPSRSGQPTCAVAGVWLHSLYEPEKEAMRFAQAELSASRPSHVVLLGPCLDYLTPAVRGILPGARISAVQYSDIFAGSRVGLADASWFPSSGLSLDAFLDSALDEDAISGVAVVEWEPAARVFPAEAFAAREAVRGSLDRLTSSTATVKASGRRWIANACFSFLLAERAFQAPKTDVPVLVAAAGPSLEKSLSAIARTKARLLTIAVSSALSACLHAGLEPDLVVATDGGYWSRLHLFPLRAKPLPLATPLTALPSAALYRCAGLVLLDQGSFAESELLPLLAPALALPPHGTVSGTAIQLAKRITSGPILAAGLDLASFGELDHARPHGFDALRECAATRLVPAEADTWERSLNSSPIALPAMPWRTSRSLQAYASALALDSAQLAGRLFRIGASPMPLPGFQEMEAGDIEAIAGADSSSRRGLALEEAPLPSRADRVSILAGRLAAWRDLASGAASGMQAGTIPSDRLVCELLRSIDIVDYAAARRAILSGGEPFEAATNLAARCAEFLGALERRVMS